jgi:hypothetical protein
MSDIQREKKERRKERKRDRPTVVGILKYLSSSSTRESGTLEGIISFP